MLFAGILRLYTRARLPFCAEWEEENDAPYFAQGGGRSLMDPPWRQAVRAEAGPASVTFEKNVASLRSVT